MTIHVQTLDRKIWRKDLLAVYLYECWHDDQNIDIDFSPEGSCAEYLGLYRMLDDFCTKTGYQKNRITISTANMIENHAEYRIVKDAESWYEIAEINQWLHSHNYCPETRGLRYHFSNFISRSNWPRLWTATILDHYHSDKTLQTYHYDVNRENYNYNGYIGIDELMKHQCDLVPQAAKFITTCPRTIDLDFLKTADYSNSLYQHTASYYPIQSPANLNLLQYYQHIFVDVVVEANVSGNCFLCTEKTWRPIVAGRPFITVSNYNFLRNLKRLGFKTFDQWWDESYDDWGEQDRIKKIQVILDEISSWSLTKLETVLHQMKPTLDHNSALFQKLTASTVQATFC
jgi:hypothetical protein